MKDIDRFFFFLFGVGCTLITMVFVVKLAKEGGFGNFLFVCVSALLTAIMFIHADKEGKK